MENNDNDKELEEKVRRRLNEISNSIFKRRKIVDTKWDQCDRRVFGQWCGKVVEEMKSKLWIHVCIKKI